MCVDPSFQHVWRRLLQLLDESRSDERYVDARWVGIVSSVEGVDDVLRYYF